MLRFCKTALIATAIIIMSFYGAQRYAKWNNDKLTEKKFVLMKKLYQDYSKRVKIIRDKIDFAKTKDDKELYRKELNDFLDHMDRETKRIDNLQE